MKRHRIACTLLLLSLVFACACSSDAPRASTSGSAPKSGGFTSTVHGTVIARSKESIVVQNKYPTSKYPSDDPASTWTDDFYVFKFGDETVDIRDENNELIGFRDIQVGDYLDVMWNTEEEDFSNDAPVPTRIYRKQEE